MAYYKVPQDVEADDKLIGPFSFRQFIYILIAAGLIFVAYLLFQVFPFLVIIPAPIIIFFLLLALPLKKDQPMEDYLAAMINFYLKPNKRFWNAGQRNTTIKILAPKIVEEVRTRSITGEEANTRLSFLANIVDTEGRSIKDPSITSTFQDDFIAENNNIQDIFETPSENLNQIISNETKLNHDEAVKRMRDALNSESQTSAFVTSHYEPPIMPTPQSSTPPQPNQNQLPASDPFSSSVVVQPTDQPPTSHFSKPQPSHKISNLADQEDLSIATIAKEAQRRKTQPIHHNNINNTDTYISLH